MDYRVVDASGTGIFAGISGSGKISVTFPGSPGCTEVPNAKGTFKFDDGVFRDGYMLINGIMALEMPFVGVSLGG